MTAKIKRNLKNLLLCLHECLCVNSNYLSIIVKFIKRFSNFYFFVSQTKMRFEGELIGGEINKYCTKMMRNVTFFFVYLS